MVNKKDNSGLFGFLINFPCQKPMYCYAENLCHTYNSKTLWNIFIKLHRGLIILSQFVANKEDNSG